MTKQFQNMEDLFQAASFHNLIGDASLHSARVILPILFDIFKPQSVVDVGCGTGAWLSVLQEFGINDILGIDGHYAKQASIMISDNNFQSQDLSSGQIQVTRQFDLAMSLEVAQYLPKKHSDLFVQSLTELAPAVLFSSAIPYQGGQLQVNEQWQHEWAERFAQRGYVPIDCLRKTIWTRTDIPLWYIQNMILYVRQDYMDASPVLRSAYEDTQKNPLSVVHPDLWKMKINHVYRLNQRHGLKNKFKNMLMKFVLNDEYTNW